MTAHVTDHPRRQTPNRARHYLALARADLPNRASKTLQKRAAMPKGDARVAQFLRIARGHTA